jgi:hypothetical protein
MAPNFIFILLLVLLVAGAVAAIIWRSWIAGATVLAIFVMAFGLYFVRLSAVQSPAPSMVNLPEPAATPAPLPRLELDPETLKNADVYPSMEEGAKYLAHRACDSIQQTQPPISTANIHIIAANKDRITEIVRQAFSEKFPQANVFADDSHGGDASDLTVTFSIIETSKTIKCLKLIPRQQGRDVPLLETCVKDAPWVSNLDDYRANHPTGEWIVGWSSELDTTQEAALKQAREEAARQMKHYVVSRFPQLNPPNFDQLIRDRLESDLSRHKYSSEEFVQQLHLPATGQRVYRAAILADVSSQQLQRVQTTILPEIHRQRDSVRRVGLGTMGLCVVICVVYLFLNWATRGYFQINLRLGAFLVLIAGVLMMLMIG